MLALTQSHRRMRLRAMCPGHGVGDACLDFSLRCIYCCSRHVAGDVLIVAYHALDDTLVSGGSPFLMRRRL